MSIPSSSTVVSRATSCGRASATTNSGIATERNARGRNESALRTVLGARITPNEDQRSVGRLPIHGAITAIGAARNQSGVAHSSIRRLLHARPCRVEHGGEVVVERFEEPGAAALAR